MTAPPAGPFAHATRIGLGATQSRVWRDGNGRVLKDMRGGRPDRVRREWEMLVAVHAIAPECVPTPLECDPYWIVMSDLGDSEPVDDPGALVASADRILEALRAAGVKHNDIQPGNLIVRDSRLHVIDFGWARWFGETPAHNERPDWHAMARAILWIEAGVVGGRA